MVTVLAMVAVAAAVAGCGSAAGSAVPSADVPAASFNGCLIPAGRPTWANILLTGGKGPFRAVWSIDGKVDSRDPQRTVQVPGKGTRVELRVTLPRVGQTFQIQVFNAAGPLVTYSFTNTEPGAPCKPDGEPPLRT